jgi:YesN/AraC family two-component response regulator
MEVFRHTGTIWNDFTGKARTPRFRVTTASATGRAVQEISEAVGYQDIAFFRKIFERHTGASPSAYRGGSGWWLN